MIPWTVACQTPLFMELSRPEYYSGYLFPSPGDVPDPGIEPGSTALEADSTEIGTCLAVQWLRLHTPNAGCPGSIPGKGAISHMSQLKIPHTTNKTQTSQINKLKKKKRHRDNANHNQGILEAPRNYKRSM